MTKHRDKKGKYVWTELVEMAWVGPGIPSDMSSAALRIYIDHFTFTVAVKSELLLFSSIIFCVWGISIVVNASVVRVRITRRHSLRLGILHSPPAFPSVSHAHYFFPLLFSPIFSSCMSLNRFGPVHQLRALIAFWNQFCVWNS